MQGKPENKNKTLCITLRLCVSVVQILRYFKHCRETEH